MLKRLFVLSPLMILIGCQDLLVNDISDQKVEIYAPKEGAVLSMSVVTFAWEDMEDASAYNIQIVSPSFESAQILWYDSLVYSNKVGFVLDPGSFEWRVRAINDVSETKYSVAKFRIDSTMDLSQQKIILYSPVDGMYVNKDSLTFNWSELYNADSYSFTLKNADGKSVFEGKTDKPHIVASFPEDGAYTWFVKAHNISSSTSEFSYGLNVDRVAPAGSVLRSPSNNEVIVEDSVSFKWVPSQNSESGVSDSLIVARDETLRDLVFTMRVENGTYTDMMEAGVYFWTVVEIDKAGNKSEISNVFSFTVE